MKIKEFSALKVENYVLLMQYFSITFCKAPSWEKNIIHTLPLTRNKRVIHKKLHVQITISKKTLKYVVFIVVLYYWLHGAGSKGVETGVT